MNFSDCERLKKTVEGDIQKSVREAVFDKYMVSYNVLSFVASAFLPNINEVEIFQLEKCCGISEIDVTYRPISNRNDKSLHPMQKEYFSNLH